MTDENECPILKDRIRIFDLTSSLNATFRQLSQVMEACRDCPQTECPIRAHINQQVTEAITEITEEWNLTATINHG